MTVAVIQISDFGLAKLMPEGQETYATVNVLGTFGYFDPEYTSVCLCYSVTSNRVSCTKLQFDVSFVNGSNF